MIDVQKYQAAFEEHAVKVFPQEACAVVAGGVLVPCTNTAVNNTSAFIIAAAEITAIEIKYGKIEAIFHTHPGKVATKFPRHWPSGEDMASWMKGSTPWVVFSCNGEGLGEYCVLDDANPEPLEGRQFIHGVNDCYSLIRDYFRMERGIVLPNYARDIEWWEKDKDLYSANFEAAGFVEISSDEVVPGDCMMIQVHAKVINHAAVITSPDKILHHLYQRLSGYDDLHKWARHASKYVRYVGDQK